MRSSRRFSRASERAARVHLNSPGPRVNLSRVKRETRLNRLLFAVSWRLQNVLGEVKRSDDSDLQYETLQIDS